MTYDCQACGACCGPKFPRSHYVAILDGDADRLPEDFRREHLTFEERGLPVIATKDTDDGSVCVALQGTVGKKVSCSIYKTRPQVCRDFAAGSEMCKAARKWCMIL
jgi:Fe-S-cluster containining protein